MLGPIAGNPRLLADLPLPAGTIVNHCLLPGVDLRVVSGPHSGVTGVTYRVILPGGRVEKVKRGNLNL